ncbi:MAG: helix-turn-helix domain-containing protein [Gammaproteobacteria bacterium]|nr:helix-turn-helix domain-containing protein [Gammaproteobacteria bacterium]
MLRDGLDTVCQALKQAVLEEVPAYSDSANPEILPGLENHLRDNVSRITALLDGSRNADFEFVREYAERLAQRRFPLEALLHTYRCTHKVLSPWLRDIALAHADNTAHVRRVVAAVADFAIEYTDTVSTTATATYVNHTRLLAEAEGDRRTELLNILLHGYDESDSRAAQLLRRAGYLEQRQSYCVVAARSVEPSEMENAARAQRMADSISEVLAATPLRTLIGVRDNLVIAVVSGTRRQSGWTAPRSPLADRLVPQLKKVGPAALIGMSNDVPSTSHIPRAAIEAKLALDFASFAERVMPYASVSVRQLLISYARNRMQSALPTWLDDFLRADAKARGKLSATLRAYADADMNVLQAAKRLSVHPNTIYARAQRISDITGRNPLSYHTLTEMLLAADCSREA